MKIAICITTFLRDELLYRCVQSILNNWQDNYVLLVGDQGRFTDEKDNWFKEKFKDSSKHYIKLEFDIGLSESRNILVEKAKELNCDYCWISADSIEFTGKYNFTSVFNWFNKDKNRGILGFNLKNRVCWEGRLTIVPTKYFYLDTSDEYYDNEDIKIEKVDMCRNFFIARTECLLENKWIPELKLSEHEIFFMELKKTKWEVGYTDYITANYIGKHNGEYQRYRQRIGEFRQIMLKKYGLCSWVKYSDSMMIRFNKSRGG